MLTVLICYCVVGAYVTALAYWFDPSALFIIWPLPLIVVGLILCWPGLVWISVRNYRVLSQKSRPFLKNERILAVLTDINTELNRALGKNPSFNSPHEGYAVILEEMDELKEEVWKNNKTRDFVAMREEAIQVGAMAVRFIVDLLS